MGFVCYKRVNIFEKDASTSSIIFIFFSHPTALWGKQQSWESISRDEIDEKIPLRYYRIDADTSIIDEPFTARIKFWEDVLNATHVSVGNDGL